MDIGGEKSIPYLNIPQEENPFLGYHAVRIYPEFAGLFRTQLRAILRAASFGNAQLMIPMVHTELLFWYRKRRCRKIGSYYALRRSGQFQTRR